MKREIHYLNTDIDLVAQQNLELLTAALGSRGVFALHVSQSDDGRWHAGLETDEQFNHPEPNIVALVMAIEALDPHFRALWSACTSREFNIGYECGDAPWAFNHELTAATLARVAALGVSLRITLYPPDTATSEPSESTPDTTA